MSRRRMALTAGLVTPPLPHGHGGSRNPGAPPPGCWRAETVQNLGVLTPHAGMDSGYGLDLFSPTF